MQKPTWNEYIEMRYAQLSRWVQMGRPQELKPKRISVREKEGKVPSDWKKRLQMGGE